MSHGFLDLARLPALNGCRRVYLGHGIAIKNMGSRPSQRGGAAWAFLRSIWWRPQGFEYWTASSDAHAEKLLAENQPSLIHPSKIINTGQARLDPLVAVRRDPAANRHVRARLAERCGLPIDAILIAYLPTFRDSGQAVFSFARMSESDREALRQVLEPHNAWVAEKSHFAEVATDGQGRSDRPSWLIDLAGDPDLDTQELLAATDILVTDYSGCFIDFLLLDRPVIHFAYDYESYRTRDRGLFFSLEEIAGGDVVSDLPAFLNALSVSIADPGHGGKRRRELRELLLAWEDGSSAQSTADCLFGAG